MDGILILIFFCGFILGGFTVRMILNLQFMHVNQLANRTERLCQEAEELKQEAEEHLKKIRRFEEEKGIKD